MAYFLAGTDTLATGIRVGAPWIEYRASGGDVVRRVHVAFGRPSFQQGHPFIIEHEEPNTGYLISEAMNSPILASFLCRLISTHLMNAGMHPRSIEDRFLSLTRAFEAIAKDKGLSSHDIKSRLEPAVVGAVSSELHSCCTALTALANTIADPGQKKSMNRIAERVRTADQRDKNFGDAVGDVADAMGFHDKQVLLSGFAASNGSNWCAFLSFLRGAVVHEGGFDFNAVGLSAREVLRVSDHLHDLLMRVYLKSLGLRCRYSSAVFPSQKLRDIDWVQTGMAADDLIFPR